MMPGNPELGAVMDIAVWLRSLGLEQYETAFSENEITEKVLPSLTAEDLKEIGVGPVGHRRTLLEAIAALRADASGKAPSVDAATTSSAPSERPEDRAERGRVWSCKQEHQIPKASLDLAISRTEKHQPFLLDTPLHILKFACTSSQFRRGM
jgi:SAM domain (Sterile alpha motif)